MPLKIEYHLKYFVCCWILITFVYGMNLCFWDGTKMLPELKIQFDFFLLRKPKSQIHFKWNRSDSSIWILCWPIGSLSHSFIRRICRCSFCYVNVFLRFIAVHVWVCILRCTYVQCVCVCKISTSTTCPTTQP